MSEPASHHRARLTLYLVHLLFPLLLAADVLWSHFFGGWSWSSRWLLVLAACGLWVGVGLVLVAGEWRRRTLAVAPNLLISFFTILLGMLCAEIVLRAVGPVVSSAPGARFASHQHLLVPTGSGGYKHFTTNEQGLRGPSPPADKRAYRIIAIGGSTTACVQLDDSEAWPEVLMRLLAASRTDTPVWVNNAGAAGDAAADHLLVLKYLPAVQMADAYVFLVGVNDLQRALESAGEPPESAPDPGKDAFLTSLSASRKVYPLMRRAALYNLVRDQIARWLPVRSNDLENRARLPRVPSPDLAAGLRRYRMALEQLMDECRQRQARCIFLTQPTMWRVDLPEAEQRQLWFGWIGEQEHPRAFVNVADLARAMDEYNHVLLEACEQRGSECYDAATAIPKDTSAFLDDCHFTARGSRLLAEFLAERLSRRPPLQHAPRAP